MTAFEIFELGDHALVATAVDAVSFETQRRVWRIAEAARGWPHVDEAIPGMNNVTVVFDPLGADLAELREALETACSAGAEGAQGAEGDPAAPDTKEASGAASGPRRAVTGGASAQAASGRHALIELPVHYGGADGPDLEAVARQADLSVEEVIERHSAPEYTVFFVGFQPGFAYLGGLDPRLATARRKEPRVQVPAGSVGIGGTQTGVYPSASPGGWQLIGRTAEVLFDPTRAAPALLEPGDRVRFVRAGGAR